SPHMKKLYGDKIRKEAGVIKTIKRAKFLQGKFGEEVVHEIQAVERIVKEVAEKIMKETAEVAGVFVQAGNKSNNLKHYSITISLPEDTANFFQQDSDDDNRKAKPIVFELGKPIHISWTAPKSQSHQDWIGVYKVTSNASQAVTNVSSRGRFVYVGEAWFKGDLLPWEVGTYEFRYHNDNKYNVMAISQPFEI
ncbi:14694_t:CDS:2, partial [Dentiscutata heterogama]